MSQDLPVPALSFSAAQRSRIASLLDRMMEDIFGPAPDKNCIHAVVNLLWPLQHPYGTVERFCKAFEIRVWGDTEFPLDAESVRSSLSERVTLLKGKLGQDSELRLDDLDLGEKASIYVLMIEHEPGDKALLHALYDACWPGGPYHCIPFHGKEDCALPG